MLKKLIFCLITIAFISGCSTTGDPTNGGIFWSEDKAKVRQQDLKNTLDDENRQGQAIKSETIDLESRRSIMQAELDRQRQLLSSLDVELDQMSRTIQRYKADTAAKQKEKQRLEKEIKILDNKISALKKDTNLSIQDRKRRISILNKEVDDLLAIIEKM